LIDPSPPPKVSVPARRGAGEYAAVVARVRTGSSSTLVLVYDAPACNASRTARAGCGGACAPHRSPARVLDVGCGTGGSEFGSRASFLEPRDRLRLVARHAEPCARAGPCARLGAGRRRASAFRRRLLRRRGLDGGLPLFPIPSWRSPAFIACWRRGSAPDRFVNPSFEALSSASRVVSRWLGEPLRWPTADVLRRQSSRGFEVLRQRRIFRLPRPSCSTRAHRGVRRD